MQCQCTLCKHREEVAAVDEKLLHFISAQNFALFWDTPLEQPAEAEIFTQDGSCRGPNNQILQVQAKQQIDKYVQHTYNRTSTILGFVIQGHLLSMSDQERQPAIYSYTVCLCVIYPAKDQFNQFNASKHLHPKINLHASSSNITIYCTVISTQPLDNK